MASCHYCSSWIDGVCTCKMSVFFFHTKVSINDSCKHYMTSGYIRRDCYSIPTHKRRIKINSIYDYEVVMTYKRYRHEK